ncbi:hypothetical protein IAT38_002808 [Cryptococcus sp. DSM 104549]
MNAEDSIEVDRGEPVGIQQQEKKVELVEPPKEKKEKHGHGKFEAEPEIPKNNLWIVMGALGLISFVSALDQSIIATALPTIAEEFHTTPSEYSWIGTAYLLSQVLMNPINGRLTDIFGRKPSLYAAVIMLFVFSALCGAAKNASWLIVARAFAGLGGGSVVSLSLIVTSDVVPLEKRGAFQGYMSAVWGIAGTLGPVIGGVLTSKASWRWCFYINLPVCAVAFALLFFFLKLPIAPGTDVAQLRKSFDFVGLILVMSGAALLIVGFSTAADEGFSEPKAYAVIIAGAVVVTVSVIHFLTTKRNAIIPARMLRTRTTLFFMFGSFFQSMMLMPSQFLLPQFFQGVGGASSLQSGVDLIPFSVGAAFFGILAGQITTRFHIVRPVIWTGFVMSSIGFGLWYHFYTSTVSYATQEGLQIIVAGGIGLAISTPMLVIQAAMPGKEMAAATSAWVLMRSMGACIGVAIFTAIFNTGLRSKFSRIEGYGTVFSEPTNAQGYQALHDLPEGETKVEVLKAFADAMRLCWIIGCALLCSALILTLFTKSYSLKRTYIPTASTGSAPNPDEPEDIEKGPAGGDDVAEVDEELTQADIDRANRELLLLDGGLRDVAAEVPASALPTRTPSRTSVPSRTISRTLSRRSHA